MTQEQMQAAYQQLLGQGHTHEVAIEAIQSAVAAAQVQAPVAQPVQPATQTLIPAVVAPAVQQQAMGVVIQDHTTLLNGMASLAALAGETDDHSTVRNGMAPLAAGPCTLRLRGYIEIGVQTPKNKAHNNRHMIHLVFEVNSPQHMMTTDAGTKPREIVVRVNKAHSNNAGYPRLFTALNACHGNKYKHASQMLGLGFMANIKHNKDEAAGITYENLDDNKTWSFAAPSGTNLDGTQYSVAIPELHDAPMMMVFDNKSVIEPQAVKQLWDSIYIDGFRDKTDAQGVVTQVSKNYYQELIRSSVTWDESMTKQILLQTCAPDTLVATTPRVANRLALAPESVAPANAVMTPALPVVAQPLHAPALAAPALAAPAVQPAVQGAVVSPAVNFQPAPALAAIAMPQQLVQEVPAVAAAVHAMPVQQAIPVGSVAPAMPQVAAGLATDVVPQQAAPVGGDAMAFLATFQQ